MPSQNDRYREIASLLRGVMLTAVQGTGARYIPWNQYLIGRNENYNEWLGRGMCRGLSVKFLEIERDGGDFITSVTGTSLDIVDRYNKPALNQEIFDAAVPGNLGDGVQALHDFMRSDYGFRHISTESFGNTIGFRSHTRFAQFIGHSPFYYLIGVPGHAMACATNKGRKVFFEPNAGIAHCNDMKQLTAFCTAYFGHDEVQRLYGHGHKVVLQAHRYSV